MVAAHERLLIGAPPEAVASLAVIVAATDNAGPESPARRCS